MLAELTISRLTILSLDLLIFPLMTYALPLLTRLSISCSKNSIRVCRALGLKRIKFIRSWSAMVRLPSLSMAYISRGRLATVSAKSRILANTADTVIALSNVTFLLVLLGAVMGIAYWLPWFGSLGACPNQFAMVLNTLMLGYSQNQINNHQVDC